MLRQLAVSVLLGIVISGTTAASPTPERQSPLEQRVDNYLSAFSEPNQLSGVLLIARGDEVLLHRGYGMADYELGVPNTRKTRFPVASITKPMLQVAFIQLVEEEKINLQDTLDRYLPGFPRGGEITLDFLLRHRSGIPQRVTDLADEVRPQTAASMARLAVGRSLVFEPGSRSSYSSAGYSVLARVMEIADERPFREILRARVFEPARMGNTLDPLDRDLVPGRASSYVPGNGRLLNAPPRDLSFLVGAGSVISTTEDLLRLYRAIVNGVYGESVRLSLTSSAVSWTGATNGYFSFLDVIPGDPETVVVFTGNSWGGAAGQLRDVLRGLIAGDPPPAPAGLPKSTQPGRPLEQYTGSYSGRPGSSLEVETRRGELFLADSVLIPIGKDRYFHQGWWMTLRFVPDEEGRIVRIDRESGSPLVRID
jgi:CubicO group peptidase (beta-lactamase class C family)